MFQKIINVFKLNLVRLLLSVAEMLTNWANSLQQQSSLVDSFIKDTTKKKTAKKVVRKKTTKKKVTKKKTSKKKAKKETK